MSPEFGTFGVLSDSGLGRSGTMVSRESDVGWLGEGNRGEGKRMSMFLQPF